MAASIKKLMDWLSYRKQNYRLVFCSDEGQAVLADLAKFCHVRSTFHPDQRVHAMLEGRREVFQRIADHMNLTTEQLYELFQEGKKPL